MAQGEVRVVIRFAPGRSRLYLPDQPGLITDIWDASLKGSTVRFGQGNWGNYQGTLSGDGHSLRGVWRQNGESHELNLTHLTSGMPR